MLLRARCRAERLFHSRETSGRRPAPHERDLLRCGIAYPSTCAELFPATVEALTINLDQVQGRRRRFLPKWQQGTKEMLISHMFDFLIVVQEGSTAR